MISYVGFVARVGKGLKVSFENVLIDGEVWLPSEIRFRGAARVMLLAKYAGEIRIDYSDYKKFSADSRILATE